MHAAATALPAPETAPSVAGKWIKAHVITGAIAVATGILGMAVDTWLQIGNPATETASKWVAAVVAFLCVAVTFAAYGALTGSVLREKLPAFSRRAWITLHAAFGTAFGLMVVSTYFKPTPSAAATVASAGPFDVPFIFFMVLVAVPALFALIAALQALVLRPAARGLVAWIAGFAIVGSVTAGFAVAVAMIDPFRTMSQLTYMLVSGAPHLAAIVLWSILMIPALNRLVPRG